MHQIPQKPGGGGGYSQNNLVGVCGPLPKTLTLFMTWPSIKTLFQNCLILSSLVETDVKDIVKGFCWSILSTIMKKWLLLRNMPNSRLQCKTRPYWWSKWLKSIPYLWPKWLKNHTFWGPTYLYSRYKEYWPGKKINFLIKLSSHVQQETALIQTTKGSVSWFYMHCCMLTSELQRKQMKRTQKLF